MRRALMLFAPVLLAVGVTPAQAAGSVISEATATASEAGEQVFVIAACDGRATAGATSTTVSCKINGVGVTRSAPGTAAVAEISAYASRPAYVCHSAFAVFLDGSIVVSPEVCDRVAP